MEISIEEDRPYLVYQGQSISLEARDLRMLKVMTPPGRKVYLRQKAKTDASGKPVRLRSSMDGYPVQSARTDLVFRSTELGIVGV